ncbi:hypothetical protein Tco_0221541 [Tanacetum coccineum]
MVSYVVWCVGGVEVVELTRWCGCGGCGVEMAAEVVMAAAAMEMKVGMMEVVSAVAGSRRSGAGYFERRGEMR